MEIIHLKNGTYQVINLPAYTVLYQGSYDDCLGYIAHIEQQQYEDYTKDDMP